MTGDGGHNHAERLTEVEWRKRDEQQRRAVECYEANHAPDPLYMTFAGQPLATSCLCGRYGWTPFPLAGVSGTDGGGSSDE